MKLTLKNYLDKRREKCKTPTKKAAVPASANSSSSKGGGPPISGIVRSAPRQLDSLKKLSSKYTPPRACNTCAIASNCPLVKPNHECAFQPVLEGFRIDTEDDLKSAILALVEKNMERVQFAAIVENLSGQVASKEVSELVKQTGFLIEQASKVSKLESGAPRDGNSIIQAIFGATQINVNRPVVPTGTDTYLLDSTTAVEKEISIDELVEAREI